MRTLIAIVVGISAVLIVVFLVQTPDLTARLCGTVMDKSR